MGGVLPRPTYRSMFRLVRLVRPARRGPPTPPAADPWCNDLGRARLAPVITIPLLAAVLALSGAPANRVPSPAVPAPYREILIIDPSAQVLRIAGTLGLPARRNTDLPTLGLRVVAFAVPAGMNAHDVLSRLRRAQPGIEADLNAMIRPAAGPVWSPGAAPNLPARASRCGVGIRLGMIDGTVDQNHPALRGQRIIQRRFLPEHKRAASSKHGTAVASLLVGGGGPGGAGAMPGATLLVGSIFERRGWTGARGDLFALLEALDWLADEGVDAVNLSFESGANTILTSALSRAAGRGLVLIAAAGNGGPGAEPVYPAAHPDVVAVTAVDPELRPYQYANRGMHIDFAAPGVGLATARSGGGVKVQSGTSFAAPLVTAAAALEHKAGVPAAQVRRRLAQRAQDLGAPGRDAVFGWGLVRLPASCAVAG